MTDAFDLRVISLGAGVQSTALYLLAVHGEVGPKPDCAIFADTQAEPPWVYEHLGWLEREFAGEIPIARVTAGSLEAHALTPGSFLPIPVRVRSDSGRDSMMRRQCTREFKLEPIVQEVRRRLGLRRGQVAKGRYRVEQWVGISLDEAQRAKPSRWEWIESRWPLVWDLPMRRGECIEWLRRHDYPIPEKSACYFCPFHDNRTWASWSQDQPAEFARAVAFDRAIRGRVRDGSDAAYLHRSLQPLDEVDFGDDTTNQLELDFGNECEGMCGV